MNNSAKLTDDDVEAIRRRRAEDESLTAIARDYPVTKERIRQITRDIKRRCLMCGHLHSMRGKYCSDQCKPRNIEAMLRFVLLPGARKRRFEKYTKPGPGTCIDWIGAQQANGSGKFYDPVLGTHNAAYTALDLDGRELPKEGEWVIRDCGRRECVNTDHFAIMSPKEAMWKSRDSKGYWTPARLKARELPRKPPKPRKLLSDEAKERIRLNGQRMAEAFANELTTTNYGKAVGISETTIKRWEALGAIVPVWKTIKGSRTRIFSVEDVEFGKQLKARLAETPGEITVEEAAIEILDKKRQV